MRITSPLGRSGTPGSIRIVAQIQAESGTELGPVRFFIDGQLFRTDEDGAPYAVEWTDENPFERREIAVAVSDALAEKSATQWCWNPSRSSKKPMSRACMVEASVQDKNGRFVKALPQSAFSVLEDGVPQVLDLARHEAVGATLALLIDSSSSMSRRLDFVQRTAATLAQYMTPSDRMVVAPFSKGLLPTTGPTDDRKTVAEAIAAIRSAGGTSILDSLSADRAELPRIDGSPGGDSHHRWLRRKQQTAIEETLATLKEAKATVYVVAIGGVAGISLKGEKVLRRIATETGGRVFMPTTEGQLELVHNALADDVQNRYLITYTPANQAHDGKWREISVVTGVPEYRVKARPGISRRSQRRCAHHSNSRPPT